MARLNLRLSDDLYAEVARGAARAGLHPASYSRERLAWAVGFAGADELRRDVARLKAELAELRKELAALREPPPEREEPPPR